jgi:O-antigen ligase
VLFLCAPLVVWAVRESGDYSSIQHAIPLSWSIRMSYWSHAIDWISDKPLRGWGLDASRMFSPGIVLHPHDGPLQVWLELGLVGAVAAAVFWAISLVRLASPAPSLAKAAVAGSATVYLLFGALNFGVWQEWWLGLGALVVMLAGMLSERPRPPGVAA